MKLGFLGAGNMAGAILEGALKAGVVAPADAPIFDVNAGRMEALRGRWGVRACADAGELAQACDLMLLGVKPNAAGRALSALAPLWAGKALISIVAGWSTEALAAALPGARVMRVMPNTPALVGAGMTALSLAHTLSGEERAFAERLFAALGRVAWIDEHLMEAATGLMGSGPAYAFLFIEAMADGGVFKGLSRAMAYEMAAQTLLGAARMVLESGRHPGELKDMVCSPGGTTIEAVRALERGGFRPAVMDAVIAAADKAERLKG